MRCKYVPAWIAARRRRAGFALVVTISLLILLTVVAVGLLSLSAISLRGTGQGAAQAQAQANARLALMLAIGELQKSLGPDRGITAPSAIYDQKPDTEEADGLDHRHLTGVWQARSETLEQTPDYSRETSFRRWLVSNADDKALESPDFARQGSLSEPVVIVGKSDGSTTPGTDEDQAQAGRVRLDGGALAWWVGDENLKAFANPRDQGDRSNSQRVADLIASTATPGSHGIRALEDFAEFPTNTATSDKLLTISTLPLAESRAGRERCSTTFRPTRRACWRMSPTARCARISASISSEPISTGSKAGGARKASHARPPARSGLTTGSP
jgi:hypothetical protein